MKLPVACFFNTFKEKFDHKKQKQKSCMLYVSISVSAKIQMNPVL